MLGDDNNIMLFWLEMMMMMMMTDHDLSLVIARKGREPRA